MSVPLIKSVLTVDGSGTGTAKGSTL